jgi:hypothetical protein
METSLPISTPPAVVQCQAEARIMVPNIKNIIKMRKYRRQRDAGCGLIMVMLMAGCSKASPSESEIKDALLQKTGHSCQNITMTDFQKVNGFAQPDGSYLEDVQFTLSLLPSGDSVKIVDKYNVAYNH